MSSTTAPIERPRISACIIAFNEAGRIGDCLASLAFCEGTITAPDGSPLCHGTGTFKYLRGMVVGGRRVARPDASD